MFLLPGRFPLRIRKLERLKKLSRFIINTKHLLHMTTSLTFVSRCQIYKLISFNIEDLSFQILVFCNKAYLLTFVPFCCQNDFLLLQ